VQFLRKRAMRVFTLYVDDLTLLIKGFCFIFYPETRAWISKPEINATKTQIAV
jgi:hypothetical protein